MTRLVLHIDRLVLRGVPPGDARALATALQAALQTHLGTPGAFAPAPAARLRAGPVRLAAGDGAGTVGQAVASAIATAGARP